MSSNEKGLLLWSLTARFPLKNAGGKITFLSFWGSGLFSGAMLNSVRAYRIFFGLFKTSNSLWGDFYTSWASPGWRRYHLCITRGDQEDCNLSWTSVKMGELGFRELESHSRFGGEVGGWFAEPFSAKTNICFFLEKTCQNQWVNEMRGLLFFWDVWNLSHIFLAATNGWNCETVVTFFSRLLELGFVEVWTCF